MRLDRRYWDSDCFLGYLQEEPDKVELCHEVLEAAEEGRVIIVTSALMIAEVLALRGRDPVPADKRLAVEAFFRSNFIIVRNITRRIAESARTYVWDYGVKPKDALHVATAIDANLALLNTFDRDLIFKSGQIGPQPLTIANPTWVEPKLPFRNDV